MHEVNTIIRVVIADDHFMVRMGLRLMLEMSEGFAVVGEAGDGAEAVRLVAAHRPDVVLLDLRMPGMGGIDVIHAIHATHPAVAILILTTYDEDGLMVESLQAGAKGYLLKDTTLEQLVQAIRTLARGEPFFQAAVIERLLAIATQRAATDDVLVASPATNDAPQLTQREREVLTRAARGERSKEIARHLGITERTVGAHLSNIYLKLDVDSRTAAVARAMQRGLLPFSQ